MGIDITIPKPTAKNISAIMVHIDNVERPELNMEDWAVHAFEVAKEAFNVHNVVGIRARHQQELVYCVGYFMRERYTKIHGLKDIGRALAKAIKRGRPYDHATVLYMKKYYEQAHQYPKQYVRYVNGCNRFMREMIKRDLL